MSRGTTRELTLEEREGRERKVRGPINKEQDPPPPLLFKRFSIVA